ncbi:MAG: hypothetical protein ACXU9U_04230 [Parachlamydiaceae bacterium]
MFERKLFFGFQIDTLFQDALSAVNKQLLGIFIRNDDEYLQELTYEKRRYLGKFVNSPLDLAALELLQVNVYSMLKRLVPNYPYEQSSLWLIPLADFIPKRD